MEKRRWQNPRIRALLGCIRALESARDSNFAILHCSPLRLLEIWKQVRQVCSSLRQDLPPLLAERSKMPAIAAACAAVGSGLAELDRDLLADLAQVPERPRQDQLPELRTKLCVAIGRLHAFSHDALGRILAADPRSQFDADYFMSRNFILEADETEWLDRHLARLEDYLRRIDRHRQANLTAVADQIERDRRLPSSDTWHAAAILIDELGKALIPLLKETLGLKGTRLEELQAMDMYAGTITTQTRLLDELFAVGHATVEGVKATTAGPDGAADCVHAVIGDQIVRRMRELDNHIGDLVDFVPVWRENIGKRRAFILGKREHGPTTDAAPT
jgi:hypothetical protein